MDNNTENKSSIRVFLDIRMPSGDPAVITKLLGMVPDELFTKGDALYHSNGKLLTDYSNKPLTRKYSCWTINSRVRKQTYDVEDHVNNIIKRVAPVKEKIKKLPKGSVLRLCVWIDISPYDSTPGVGLGLKSLKFLSDIGCDLDVDISVFCPEQDVGNR